MCTAVMLQQTAYGGVQQYLDSGVTFDKTITNVILKQAAHQGDSSHMGSR